LLIKGISTTTKALDAQQESIRKTLKEHAKLTREVCCKGAGLGFVGRGHRRHLFHKLRGRLRRRLEVSETSKPQGVSVGKSAPQIIVIGLHNEGFSKRLS
jgi:hypothetical protein